jgi:CheY-like chemotaxis protein
VCFVLGLHEAIVVGRSKRILLVDNDLAFCEFVALLLADEGYHVTTVANGQAALDCVARVQPHLILLDLHMPVMDGQAFVHAYRARPSHHAPVIIISALPQAETMAHGLGVEHCLLKPFNIDDLLACVHRCLLASDGTISASAT